MAEAALFGIPKKKTDTAFDFSPYKKINFGCGYEKLEGYLNVDIDEACAPDLLIPSGDLSLMPKYHFEEIYAKDVLEHIPRVNTVGALLGFSSLLKNSGTLIVQTTSITQVAKMLEKSSSFSDQYGWTTCLFGNQQHPGDFHFTGFTETTLKVYLKAAGFDVVSESMVDDWMMRFHCVKTEAWDSDYSSNESDLDFLQIIYNRFFGRAVDEIGTLHFGALLRNGVSRRQVMIDLLTSPERLFVTSRRMGFDVPT